MSISKDDFRWVLGHFATGVTIVTMRDDEGKPCGLTVNSFTSVSLEPFLVLICIDHSAQGYNHLSKGKYFGVTILTEEQQELSSRFANRQIADRFDGISYFTGKTGVPLLANALATLECRIIEAYPGGDHTIFVGEVVEISVNHGRPLLFYRGRYTQLVLEAETQRSVNQQLS